MSNINGEGKIGFAPVFCGAGGWSIKIGRKLKADFYAFVPDDFLLSSEMFENRLNVVM